MNAIERAKHEWRQASWLERAQAIVAGVLAYLGTMYVLYGVSHLIGVGP